MAKHAEMDIHLVPTMTHGRVLVREARAAARTGVLVGFHGYMENAQIQMERLEAIPGASGWTLVSIQGLHRFYRGRTDEVVASWMTSEDRETAIAAIGGDVPPELLADRSLRFPQVLFARGAHDEWLTQAKFDRDVSSLTARGAPLTQLVYEGAHEWNTEVSGAIGDFLKSVTS